MSIERRVLNAHNVPVTYTLGWDFSPSSRYLHVTQVNAISEEEAINYLVRYLKDAIGFDIDVWVLRDE